MREEFLNIWIMFKTKSRLRRSMDSYMKSVCKNVYTKHSLCITGQLWNLPHYFMFNITTVCCTAKLALSHGYASVAHVTLCSCHGGCSSVMQQWHQISGLTYRVPHICSATFECPSNRNGELIEQALIPGAISCPLCPLMTLRINTQSQCVCCHCRF